MINLIKQEVYKNNPDSEIIAIFETGSQLLEIWEQKMTWII